MKPGERYAAVVAEFQRLGLAPTGLPALAASDGEEGFQRFLVRLRSLAPGATWNDVFPDWPTHWVPGRPETYIARYKPLGPFDYQELPTSPAVHINWPKDGGPERLESFVAAARQAGFPIYGAGIIAIDNPGWRTIDAHVVLERSIATSRFDRFLEWIEKREDVNLAVISRRGHERYFEE